jgi:hypothetical protein
VEVTPEEEDGMNKKKIVKDFGNNAKPAIYFSLTESSFSSF